MNKLIKTFRVPLRSNQDEILKNILFIGSGKVSKHTNIYIMEFPTMQTILSVYHLLFMEKGI